MSIIYANDGMLFQSCQHPNNTRDSGDSGDSGAGTDSGGWGIQGTQGFRDRRVSGDFGFLGIQGN